MIGGFNLQKLRKEVGKKKKMGLIFENEIELTYDLRIIFFHGYMAIID